MINRSNAWEKACNDNPDDPNAQASLEEARNHKQVYQKTQLESLVQRYPNDYANRFELGLLLFEEGGSTMLFLIFNWLSATQSQA